VTAGTPRLILRVVRLTRRDRATVWAATLVAHGLFLALFAWHLEGRTPGDTDLDQENGAFAPAAESAAEDPIDVSALAEVALLDEAALAELLAARPGPADQSGFAEQHPLPGAEVDLPGTRAAGRGGGAEEAGATSFSGRSDPDTLRTQFWTDPNRYLVPHRRNTDRSASSPEWIARRERSGYGAREPQPTRARAGAEAPVAGTPGATGTGGDADEQDRRWHDVDPRYHGAPIPDLAERVAGSTSRPDDRLLVETGERATEAERLGRLRDPVDSASASNARTTGPLELTRPSSGGRAEDGGVEGGRDRAGPLERSPHRGNGSAASTADLATGRGRESLRAARTDPYFRRLFERLDRTVRFPRELALALEQGDLVVTFSLAVGDGAIGDLKVVKSSGFAEFDRELIRALGQVGPLGPVPRALRGKAPRLLVTAPYAFKSPLIR
jgi:TonB family protein